MKLSIVSTLYNSAPHLDEFYDRCTHAAKKFAGSDYEIIFVNDKSPDESLIKAVNLHAKDKHVKVVDLSRNFGHHKAIMAGLDIVKGEYVFLIDSDLEEAPEWLEDFATKIHEFDGVDTIDVVYGVQKKRKGGMVERVTGNLFFSLFERLAGTSIPRNLVTARLMRKKYVDALMLHKESEYFIAGLWAIVGFQQEPILVKKLSTSPTNYTFSKRIRLALNAIISFSTIPLKAMLMLGILVVAVTSIYSIALIVKKLMGSPIDGWTSLMVAIYFFGGVNLLSVGMVGLYVSKIFQEVKNRPNAIIRQLYD